MRDENKDRVFAAVNELAGDEGAHLSALTSITGLHEADVVKAMKALFSEGKIFEPRAGKFKPVE